MLDNRVIIDRSFTLQRAEGDEHVFQISDESVDSHGTVFLRNCWDMSQYARNPIVTYGHPSVNSSDPDDVIGVSEVYFDGTRMMGKVMYNPKNPKAMRIKEDVEGGYIRMASIRAYASEARWGVKEAGEDDSVLYFTRAELIDWGIVMHGSNKNAMKREDIARTLNIGGAVSENNQNESGSDDEGMDSSKLDEARALMDGFVFLEI